MGQKSTYSSAVASGHQSIKVLANKYGTPKQDKVLLDDKQMIIFRKIQLVLNIPDGHLSHII